MNLYLENYGIYAEWVQNKHMVVDVRNININNYEMHYNSVLNIMKDTIETEYLRTVFLTVDFGGGLTCDLSIQDYWINLILWYHVVRTNGVIGPRHLYFEHTITRGNIKKYIDKNFIDVHLKDIDIIQMNNIIDDSLHRIVHVDKFSWYLANTINLEDFIDLMEKDSRFYQLLHADLSTLNVADVKDEGMKLANESIDIIMNSNHGLANFFRANEGINKKQYKEVAINIGTKPDGQGGIFPKMVNRSFIMGGVKEYIDYYIESNNGRIAQIIVDKNVGGSGAFARLLGLNNSDSKLHPDRHYKCDTKNYEMVEIVDDDVLKRLNGRYYKLDKEGAVFRLSAGDTHLKGQTIYLYSPMTCASAARGEGICYRCYGDLAYINKDINIGKLAAELLSSVLTQKMLSAKHLLEAAVIALIWNLEFEKYFEVEFNIIKCRQDVEFNKISLIINTANISADDDDEDDSTGGAPSYLEYIESYALLVDGVRVQFNTENYDNLFITPELSEAIKSHGKPYNDEEIIVDLNNLKNNEIPLFTVQIFNNDLNAILEKIQGTINNKGKMKDMDKDGILQMLLNNLKEGGLDLSSVHAEVILSNQLRDNDDILEYPNWAVPDQKYKLLTLKGALKDNPRIGVSLAFESIKRMLYNPLTFRKTKASTFDLFYMVKPQEFLYDKSNIIQKEPDMDENGLKIVYRKVPEDKV